MKFTNSKTFSALTLSTLISSSAFAWGDLGHGTVGYIAERFLTPKGKAFAHQLVGQDPLSEVAIWPDQVRSDSRYNDFSKYHFLTIPEGSNFATRPEKFIAERDANTILSQAPSLFASKTLEIRQKEVLFRYFVHVAGDVHQPLHVGNQSDMGANLCQIKIVDPYNAKYTKSTNLHSAWDDVLVNHLKNEVEEAAEAAGKKIRYFAPKDLGEFLLTEYQKNPSGFGFEKAKTESASLETWYNESATLRDQIYPDGSSKYKAEERPYCRRINPETDKVEDGAFKEQAIPTMDLAYIEKAKPIVKKQILIAGFRLAYMINQAAEKTRLKAWTPETEKTFFEKVLISNVKTKGRDPSSTKSFPTPSCEH